MKNRDKILIAGGGALALWLLSRKKSDLLIDNSDPGKWSDGRFDTYDYYDTTTQLLVKEQEKKNSPYYFGDKSPNSIYDPFYDYTDSPDQRDIVNQSIYSWANTDMPNALRVRIVPNSLRIRNHGLFSNNIGANGGYYNLIVATCIIEIFNPFSTVDPVTPKLSFPQISSLYLSNVKVNNSVVSPFLHYNTAYKEVFYPKSDSGITKFLDEEFYYNWTNPKEGKVETLQKRILNNRSVFLPEVLSYTPYLSFSNGKFNNNNYSPIDIWQFKASTLFDDFFGIDFDVNLSITGKDHQITSKCSIKKGEQVGTKYKYNVGDPSESVSYQSSKYFTKTGGMKIYDRPEVCEYLLPYHELPNISEVKNGMVESLNMLMYVDGMEDYGTFNPWKVLYG